MVRKHKTRDAWAGHVCLPGGRLEPGEEPLEAAVRETHEEAGLALVLDGSRRNASLLGQLDDRSAQGLRPAWLRTRPPLHVSAFVFHLYSGDEQLELQAKEIDAACWVPVSQLWDASRLCEWPLRLGTGLSVACPAVQLASRSPVVLSMEALPDRLVPEASSGGLVELGERWRLWGLTLGITEDLRHALAHDAAGAYIGGVEAGRSDAAGKGAFSRLDWPPAAPKSLAMYLPLWLLLAAMEAPTCGARGRWSWSSVAVWGVLGVACVSAVVGGALG